MSDNSDKPGKHREEMMARDERMGRETTAGEEQEVHDGLAGGEQTLPELLENGKQRLPELLENGKQRLPELFSTPPRSGRREDSAKDGADTASASRESDSDREAA